jgi:hypothetical protein
MGRRGSEGFTQRTRRRRLATWPDWLTSVHSRRIAWGAAGQLKKRTPSPSRMGARWTRISSIRFC